MTTIALAVLLMSALGQGKPPPLVAVPFQQVKVADTFFAPRIEVNRTRTIEANLEKCESTGRIRNFRIAGGLEKGEHEGQLYNDSDVYKVLEGVAYTLAAHPDEKLEARADAIIDAIAAAQREDGYLDTYYTLVKPEERWKNIRFGHELYCAGHLIEAAVAYTQATKKEKLLDVAYSLANLLVREFGPGKRLDPCGHPEIELALMKLASFTGDERYSKLARFFVDQRGSTEGRTSFGEYAQDHKPLREQTEVVGHAVRAMYLYSGAADVAAAFGDRTLLAPLVKIWDDLVQKKMYVTGGIGPSASNEGFTVAYDLPNDTAYCETCAAIGMLLWNERLFLMTRESKYADLVERELYNNIPAGVSLAGDTFFYDNPLASRGDHHRVPWFDCSCCPTNIVRTMPSVGQYVYAVDGDDLYVTQYVAGTAQIDVGGQAVKLTLQTKYPWQGDVLIRFDEVSQNVVRLHLRLPAWCKRCSASWSSPRLRQMELDQFASTTGLFRLDEGACTGVLDLERGWAAVSREWLPGDTVSLHMELRIERVQADPHVEADAGRVALMRGPLVYCVEGADNGGHARDIALPREKKLTSEWMENLLGGAVLLRGPTVAAHRFPNGERGDRNVDMTAIPYCLWDNREPGEMVVWIPESVELAEIRGGGQRVEQNGVELAASHCWKDDTLLALNDKQLPKSSSDESIPRMTFWDHRGTREWVQMTWKEPQSPASVRVYWFDDSGRGSCRRPKGWRVSYLDGDVWKPVELGAGSRFDTAKDSFNTVRFEPVTTRALRVEVELQPGLSAGILELEVNPDR